MEVLFLSEKLFINKVIDIDKGQHFRILVIGSPPEVCSKTPVLLPPHFLWQPYGIDKPT